MKTVKDLVMMVRDNEAIMFLYDSENKIYQDFCSEFGLLDKVLSDSNKNDDATDAYNRYKSRYDNMIARCDQFEKESDEEYEYYLDFEYKDRS